MALVLHGIPNCDTVRRARAWLAERSVDARFHDFRRDGLTADTLSRWCERLGWEALLNTRGTTWRGLDAPLREGVRDATSACALMQAHPSLVRRPVVVWPDGSVSVGFDPGDWARRLGTAA